VKISGKNEKNQKKEEFLTPAQPRWLAGHRAGTGQLAGEEGGGNDRILQRGQSLSL